MGLPSSVESFYESFKVFAEKKQRQCDFFDAVNDFLLVLEIHGNENEFSELLADTHKRLTTYFFQPNSVNKRKDFDLLIISVNKTIAQFNGNDSDFLINHPWTKTA